MRRLPILLALAMAALPAAAQGAAVLGGWALPEGAVVTSSSTTSARLDMAGQPVESQAADESVTTIDGVEDGRLVRAVQRLEASVEKTLVGGFPVPSDPDPLLGRAVVIERDGDGWRRRALGWAPSGAALEALDAPISLDDAEYPDRPVAVGETVEVPADVLRRVYPGATADGDHRLTVTLDSLGMFEGGPAAFLTQEVHVTTADDDVTMRMDMTARIVRRLDWGIDVRTVWDGAVAYDLGPVAMEGTMRHEARQSVELPDGD